MKTATNFYRKLYDCQTDNLTNISTGDIQPPAGDESHVARIDELEVIEGIKRLKVEKCPGPDGITNEAIKEGCQYLTPPLTRLFNSILVSGTTPSQLSDSTMILLYKKGDPTDIGNYRPISLLPALY